ncbi:MAG: hypothetical protein KC483_01450 [Nitrosarchaeum sp.]|nr:hypothetical protein [Nitrosarchaeum sp.]
MKHSNSEHGEAENFPQNVPEDYESRVNIDEAFSSLYPTYDISLEYKQHKQKRTQHRQHA